jgi:hypothetical protein
MYSSVIPGNAMSGAVAGQIQFPGWLGRNSRANKMQRLCQEIHAHTRLRYHFHKTYSTSRLQSTAHQTREYTQNTLCTLYRSYVKGISANIEVQVYSVTCCWLYKTVNGPKQRIWFALDKQNYGIKSISTKNTSPHQSRMEIGKGLIHTYHSRLIPEGVAVAS